MQTQAIDTAATAPIKFADRSPTAPSESATGQGSSWYCLPLQQLNNFESVHHQFAAQQVWFEAAIALRPSNPYFQAGEASLTLMANPAATGLKMRLGNRITEIDFGYISSAPLTISCLDDQGHCVAIVRTAESTARLHAAQPESGRPAPNQYDIQGITLNPGGARTLRIHSTAPFVLTRCWVKQEPV